MGGPSGPTPFARFAAIRHKSVGPEGPPTKSRRRHYRASSLRRKYTTRSVSSNPQASCARCESR
ncbi:DUF6053 domain-containing protein [Lysobacter enzymogenes]|uniref:DUF6053 domain-containing protein n=1 Tax=Lysobacter enzymogenes TaxID=69 RepID=UPI003CCDFBE8